MKELGESSEGNKEKEIIRYLYMLVNEMKWYGSCSIPAAVREKFGVHTCFMIISELQGKEQRRISLTMTWNLWETDFSEEKREKQR